MTNQVADEESRTTTDRLDWKLSLSENQCHLGSPGSRPICLAPLLSTEPVLQLETGSTGRSNRCLSSRLEASEGLCQPSLVLSRESSETSEGSKGSGDIGGSDLEKSAVVPRSPGDALGFPSVDSPVSRSVSHDLRDSSHELSASTSRVAYLRGKFVSQNLSSKARDLRSCWLPGEQSPTRLTIPISKNGYAGALQGVQIPFLDL